MLVITWNRNIQKHVSVLVHSYGVRHVESNESVHWNRRSGIEAIRTDPAHVAFHYLEMQEKNV